MNKLEVRHIEEIAYQLAVKWMGAWEPIPPFITRFPEKLESSLNTPFQTYAKKPLYPTLADKATILFYLMIKNHPFQNGNKRIAITTLLTFLAFNQKWLKISNEELYRLAMRVAVSEPRDKDKIVRYVRGVIELELIDLSARGIIKIERHKHLGKGCFFL